MQRILVPVDGSENALAAVRQAAAHDVGDGAKEVHLLFVGSSWFQLVPRHVAIRERRKFRDAEAEQAFASVRDLLDRLGVRHAEHIETGDKAAAIHRVAQRVQASSILMGVARKVSLTRLLENRIISTLQETAKVPVQIVTGKSVSTLEKCGVPIGAGAAAAMLMVAVE